MRAVSLSAIVEFLVNLESFALWVEIPAQVLAFLFTSVAVMTIQDTKHVAIAKLANAYLVSYVLSALVWAGWHLVTIGHTPTKERFSGSSSCRSG